MSSQVLHFCFLLAHHWLGQCRLETGAKGLGLSGLVCFDLSGVVL